MLFFVTERFRNGDIGPVGERFARMGRMLPEGVSYVASWIVPSGAICYQLMEAPDAGSLLPWLKAWEDLVEFEVTPVLNAKEFWEGRKQQTSD